MRYRSIVRIVGVIVLSVLLELLSNTVACSRLEKNVVSGEKTTFRVPDGVMALEGAEIKVSSVGVTVCNHSDIGWSNLQLQLSTVGTVYEESLPPHPPVYIAQIGNVDARACKETSIEDFFDPSPKRLKAYRGIRVTKVEVLADIQRKAYAVREFSNH